MEMDDTAPLLSICIPTCNRASFLEVMLQALLPQASTFLQDVEVLVLDNASTDETQRVLEKSQRLGPFRIARQPVNVGPIQNVVDGPATLARGRYSWVLGDHNLLRPGALELLLDQIKNAPDCHAFYVNFQVASYPQQWPTSAHSGYDGPFDYCGNPEIVNGTIPEWKQLLRPYSALCTQVYAHVIRTDVWRNFWKDRKISIPYSCALTTYPHTMMIIETLFSQPTTVIANPLITIFNGAQSWSNVETQVKVYFTGLPLMLERLQSLGVCDTEIKFYIKYFHLPEAIRVAARTMQKRGRLRGLLLLLRHAAFRSYCRRAVWRAIPDGMIPDLMSAMRQIQGRASNYRNSYFYNCRPMRWLRAKTRLPLK